MLTTKLEVLPDFGSNPDQKVVDTTLKELKSKRGIQQAEFKNGAFVVETVLPSADVLDMVMRFSGRRAVLQGFGDTQSAVAMVSSQPCCSSNVIGVVRFQQSQGGGLVADGCIDGLSPGCHGLHIHDTGDLSQGCDSIGGHYNPSGTPHGSPEDPPDKRHAGDLGNISANETGRATFRIVDTVLNVWDIVGRSVAVTERADDLGRGDSPQSKLDGDSGRPVGCGVIARSAGVFQNPKRICQCDGVIVWDERDKPLAGMGRRDGGCCKSKGDGDSVKEKKTCCKV